MKLRKFIFDNSTERKMLLSLNEAIHKDSKMFDYHMKHINITRNYALLINKRLGSNINKRIIDIFTLSHDLLKERSLNPKMNDKIYNNWTIPQDLNRYVRMNLDILEEYGLDEYFNTDIQLHALSAGIFLRKELGIKDKQILYPVMFHSCPIISVYETLDIHIKTAVDIMMLADKLSSNYLRINLKETPVRIDLDQAVFGPSGNEFNYTLGLFLARLISQGNSKEEQSIISTEYYYKRLCKMNPIISKSYSVKKLGDNVIWPKRKSKALKML